LRNQIYGLEIVAIRVCVRVDKDPRESSFPFSVVDTLLNFASRPWKAAALVVFAVVGMCIYVAWDQRIEISHYMLTKEPALDSKKFPKIAEQMIDNYAADMVILSEVNLSSNRVANIDGRLRDDPAWRPRPYPRAIFNSDAVELRAEPGIIIRFIEGHVICEAINPTSGFEQVRVDIQEGMVHRCLVGIPPIAGILIGTISLGWKTIPTKAREQAATIEMQHVASELAVW